MKDNMTKLWNKYPVKFTTKGNITTISFASSNNRISALDNTTIGTIYESRVGAIQSSSINPNSVVSPMWAGDQHKSISYDAATKWGFPYATTVQSCAAEPDNWQANIPGWLPSEVQNFLQTCIHSYEHYFNPVFGWGDAPSYTATYANLAKQNVPVNWYNAAVYLGWSSHFIEDVGNPMHTGGEANQAYDYFYHPPGYPNMHDAYEGYVGSNWVGGYNFKSYVTNNNNYITVTNPDLSTRAAASYSNQSGI